MCAVGFVCFIVVSLWVWFLSIVYYYVLQVVGWVCLVGLFGVGWVYCFLLCCVCCLFCDCLIWVGFVVCGLFFGWLLLLVCVVGCGFV